MLLKSQSQKKIEYRRSNKKALSKLIRDYVLLVFAVPGMIQSEFTDIMHSPCVETSKCPSDLVLSS